MKKGARDDAPVIIGPGHVLPMFAIWAMGVFISIIVHVFNLTMVKKRQRKEIWESMKLFVRTSNVGLNKIS